MTGTTKRKTLRFVQLSDPHLSSLQSVKVHELANKRLLGYLSWNTKRRAEHRPEVLDALKHDLATIQPDHIVVTGDLTQIGLHDEFRQARRWLESLGTPEQVTVIPGNHDAYVRSSWQQSFSHWEAYMASDAINPNQQVVGNARHLFPSLRLRGPVAFIGLSSARPSAPFLAVGSIGSEQLGHLARYLRETAKAGLFRVIMVHHAPVQGKEKWRKRLTDARQLCEVIKQFGAELVLHGHSHRAVETAIEIPGSNVPVFGIPSASAIGHKAGRISQYYIYDIMPDTQSWKLGLTVREFCLEKSCFVKQQEKSFDILR